LDVAKRVYAVGSVVKRRDDVHVTQGVRRQARGGRKRGTFGGRSIGGRAEVSRPRKGGDDAARIHSTHGIIAVVADVEVALRVGGQRRLLGVGQFQVGVNCLSVVAEIARRAGPSEGVDVTVRRRDFADAVG